MVKEKKKNRVAQLLRWAGKDKYYLYFAIFLALISGVSVAIPYYSIFKILEAVYQNGFSPEGFPFHTIVYYGILLLVSFIIRYLPTWASILASHKGAYNTLYRVRCIVDHMGKVPMGSLSTRNTGEVKAVLTDEVEKLELFLAHHLTELVQYASGPIAVFCYLCSVHVGLALLSLVPLILALGMMGIMFASQSKAMGPMFASMGKLNTSIIEYINGMKLIKAYNLGARSFKSYSNAVDTHRSLWKKISRIMGKPYAAYVVLVECGMALMLPLGGFLLIKGSILPGAFILFAFVGSMYLTELRPLQELGTNFANVLGAVDHVNELLDIPAYSGGQNFPQDATIAFTNVGFGYTPGTPVLTDVTLTIKQGEKLAVVGPSGAGKSTLAQLAVRSFEVQEGSVTIGGIDVHKIDYEKILQNTAVVFQKPFLSQQSVLENIRMGSSADINQVREAARQAQIDDFIMSLPNGYDTLVGSYGSRFSGGEKQRITIARAILKMPLC
ncbi:MAG: ABC transporter ATP-binding protein [Oscillospiraceae bacterium]